MWGKLLTTVVCISIGFGLLANWAGVPPEQLGQHTMSHLVHIIATKIGTVVAPSPQAPSPSTPASDTLARAFSKFLVEKSLSLDAKVPNNGQGPSASVPTRDNRLSIVLTSVESNVDEFAGSFKCYVNATVNNGTAYHIDRIIAGAPFITINIGDLRAYQKYTASFSVNASCAEVVRSLNSPSNGFSIEHCDAAGLREGDCLNMVNVMSTIPVEMASRAAQIETGLIAQCRARLSQYKQYMACLGRVEYLPTPRSGIFDFNTEAERLCGQQSPDPVVSCP